MDDTDKISVLLYGINGTKGLIDRVYDMELSMKEMQTQWFLEIGEIKKALTDAEQKHVNGWQKYLNEHCGVDCKGSVRISSHEQQHKQLVDITQQLANAQLEERKSRRTVLVAVIAAAVPGLITLVKELMK